ncbi:hypothetical protein [Streptomyces sp. PAN_FS17]|uniref:hypothetical protein n=1 Tax=Streptomyces sp. PAN_FS17 TaxID=1855351 RepID=UPI00115F7FFF|nr:hypothetical protein [Streptomyces sp. PAN_FS17]
MRAIERITVSKAMWSERDREIHAKSLSEAAKPREGLQAWNLREDLKALRKESEDDCARNESVNLTLPITELPKVPILDMRINVDKERVYRVRLDDSARIQARYIRYLSADIDEIRPIGKDLEEFLAALFYFPTHAYDKIWRSHWNRLRGEQHKIQQYLKKEPLLESAIENGSYDEWSSLCETSKRVVLDRAFHEYVSGTQNPLLALPHFVRVLRERPGVQGELKREEVETNVTTLLRKLECFLSRAEGLVSGAERGTPTAVASAEKVLAAYAAYGYRWMAFAKCEVPLNKPFMIEVEEQRAIYFAWRRRKKYRTVRKIPFGEYAGKTAWKMVSFDDAETNHVSIRVADTAVRMLQKFEILNENGDRRKGGEVDEEKETFELYLRHSSLKRPERLWIKCHLRLSRVTSCFLYLAMIITAFAVFLLMTRGAGEVPHTDVSQSYEVSMQGDKGTVRPKKVDKDYTHGLTAKDATLILVPASFVASFLLVKDSSTLVMRVRRFRQAILVSEFFVLLAVAFSLFYARDIWSSP